MNQFFNDFQRLKAEVERLKVRLNSIAVGQTLIPSVFAGILPIANGGTSSPFGPMSVVAMFLNNSGGNLNDGDVVVLDPLQARSITTTGDEPDVYVLGAVRGSGPFADGEETPVLVLGYHPALKVVGAVASGDYLVSSATTPRAVSVVIAAEAGVFATAATSAAGPGNGTVQAWLYPVVLGAGGGGGPVISDQTANTNGVLDTFTLPSEFQTGTVRVWLNGLFQRPGVDFTVTAPDLVVMADPPATADELVIVYGNEGSTPFLFTQLLDAPDSFTGSGGFAVFVKDDESGLEFVELPDSSEAKFANMRPASPNAMDDEYDDSTGSSGTVNGIAGKWTARGTAPSVISYPAPSWAFFRANNATFGYDQARPVAQDYTVDMRCSIGGDVASGNSFGGLYLRDSVNGDMYTLHLLIGNNNARMIDVEVASWGNSGTFLGGAFTLLKGIAGQPGPFVLRIAFTQSSGAVNFSVSYDGGVPGSFVLVHTIAADAIGHTHVGWFKTGSGSGSAFKDELAVDWFRRTL